jgi:hypothetical protein
MLNDRLRAFPGRNCAHDRHCEGPAQADSRPPSLPCPERREVTVVDRDGKIGGTQNIAAIVDNSTNDFPSSVITTA